MRHLLKRHPVPVCASFDFTLALTFALPEQALRPHLYPGVTLDTFNGLGFVAIAMVQTRSMRPAFLPSCAGRDFFLIGYRIFVRYRTVEGRLLRGLQVLRSDTDRRFMTVLGNLFTHYRYRRAGIAVDRNESRISIEAVTPDHGGDLSVLADLRRSEQLPAGSPFENIRTARRFAGPMPFTFSFESETRSIVRIEGARQNWHPRPVDAHVAQGAFLHRFSAPAALAAAFLVENVPYRWKRGVTEKLPLGGGRS